MECDDKDQSHCIGDVIEGRSRSGASVYVKCVGHWTDYDKRMDKVEADIRSRYPGYDIPGSPPPPDFDPLYAGESWDEE